MLAPGFILILAQNLWDPARAEARGWEHDLAAGREFYSLFCNACGHHQKTPAAISGGATSGVTVATANGGLSLLEAQALEDLAALQSAG